MGNSTWDLLNIPILKITKPNNTVIMSNSANSADQTGEKSFLSNLVSGKTPAVKNIEAAYSRAGATNNHTPGAASQLGSQDQKSGASEHQGVGSAKFKEGISDQRQEVRASFSADVCFLMRISVADGMLQPSIIGKMFNNVMNGTDSTK